MARNNGVMRCDMQFSLVIIINNRAMFYVKHFYDFQIWFHRKLRVFVRFIIRNWMFGIENCLVARCGGDMGILVLRSRLSG